MLRASTENLDGGRKRSGAVGNSKGYRAAMLKPLFVSSLSRNSVASLTVIEGHFVLQCPAAVKPSFSLFTFSG